MGLSGWVKIGWGRMTCRFYPPRPESQRPRPACSTSVQYSSRICVAEYSNICCRVFDYNTALSLDYTACTGHIPNTEEVKAFSYFTLSMHYHCKPIYVVTPNTQGICYITSTSAFLWMTSFNGNKRDVCLCGQFIFQ